MRAKFINEGAWGHGPLDNDSASDWKWQIGDVIIEEIKEKLNSSDKNADIKMNHIYYAIGMWEFLKERLKTNYSFFTDEEIEEMDNLTITAAGELLEDGYGSNYSSPDKIKIYLQNYINQI